MRKAIQTQVAALSFIFVSRSLFTIFPDLLKNNYIFVVIINLLYLLANVVPIWFFLELKKEMEEEIRIGTVIDLVLVCLSFNLVHRVLIVALNLGVSTLYVERLLYQIRFIVPILLYNSLLYFFLKVRQRCINTRFSKLKNIFQMNEIGFGLLVLITAAGVIDHLTGGNLYQGNDKRSISD